MPRSSSEIPALKLVSLEALITSWMTAPNLLLTNFFGEDNAASDTIEWESVIGNRGMTPFNAPNAPAPQTSPVGVAKHSAKAAFWNEKIGYGEEFLNNIRKPGTYSEHQTAAERLAMDLAMLRNRQDRRKEWMLWKMLVSGSFSYLQDSGLKLTVDYGIPSAHSVTLGANAKWHTGGSRDILGDITSGKRVISDANGSMVDVAFCNSTVLQYLSEDPTIRTLLQKSTFGDGNLFKPGTMGQLVNANPMVLAQIIGLPKLVVYDESYVVKAWLTAAVTGSSTVTIYVDEVEDFEVGGTLRFHDASAGTYEDETISAVNVETGTLTISTAPTASFKAAEDYVTMTRKFIPDDKFIMMASSVEGKTIAKFRNAPHGLLRRFGVSVSRWDEEDPEMTYIKVENKGLPVLYHKDAVYVLDVE